MTWFEEMKTFFVVARVYGIAPYSFVNGEIRSSRRWRIYSFICLVAHFFICITRPLLVNTIIQGSTTAFPPSAYFIRSLAVEISFAVESFASIRSFDQLLSAIDFINDYDRAFRVNFAKRSLVVHAWAILMIAPTINLGLAIFILNNYESMLIQTYHIYGFLWIGNWLAMIFKFTATVNSIHRRFQHLHAVIIAERPAIIYGSDRNWRRPIRLSDIGRLHGNLISAAILINSMHNTGLLLWLGKAIIISTLRLRTLIPVITTSILQNSELTLIMIMTDIAILWSLCFCCHRASEAANKIGYMALSTRSCVLRNRFRYERDENFFVGQHFIKNPLHFTAGYGVFTVDLHLLQTILATVTTLVVNFAT